MLTDARRPADSWHFFAPLLGLSVGVSEPDLASCTEPLLSPRWQAFYGMCCPSQITLLRSAR